MSQSIQFSNIYYKEFIPAIDNLKRKYDSFVRAFPVNLDALNNQNAEFQNLIEKTKAAHQKLKTALQTNPPSQAAHWGSLIDSKLDTHLQMVSKAMDSCRRAFEEQKRGSRKSRGTIHPRALYPMAHSSQGLVITQSREQKLFPLGITNFSATNCWAISLIHILMEIKSMREEIFKKLPFQGLKDLMHLYHQEQLKNEAEPGKHSLSSIDIRKFRQVFSQLFPDSISSASRQEDAYEALMLLFNSIDKDNPFFTPMITERQHEVPNYLKPHLASGRIPDLDYRGCSQSRQEPQTTIFLENIRDGDFSSLIENFFISPQNNEAKRGQWTLKITEERRKFLHLPQHLFIGAKRFIYTETGGKKLDTNIGFPETFALLPHHNQKGKYGKYVAKGSIQHIGAYGGGHYIAYIRIDAPDGPKWVCCNDSSVRIVNDAELRAGLDQSYFLYYELIGEVNQEEARRIMEKYPTVVNQMGPGSIDEAFTTFYENLQREAHSLTAYKGYIDQLKFFGMELDSEDKLYAKILFDQLIPEDQEFFKTLYWLDKGKDPNQLEAAFAAITANPSLLATLQKPWIIDKNTNVVEQYISISNYEYLMRALDLDLKILKEALRPEFDGYRPFMLEQLSRYSMGRLASEEVSSIQACIILLEEAKKKYTDTKEKLQLQAFNRLLNNKQLSDSQKMSAFNGTLSKKLRERLSAHLKDIYGELNENNIWVIEQADIDTALQNIQK